MAVLGTRDRAETEHRAAGSHCGLVPSEVLGVLASELALHPAVLKTTWQAGHRKLNMKRISHFKGGKKNMVCANYKPVSLASTTVKSLERLIKGTFCGKS